MKRQKRRLSLLLALTLLLTMIAQVGAFGGSIAASAADGVPDGPTGTLSVSELKVESLENPLGTDVENPMLSWLVTSDGYNQKQTAYQVLVAASPEKLGQNEGDLWDSGRVASEDPFNCFYEGEPLVSRQRVWWKVRVWDALGQVSDWSQPAFWEAGLLNESDWQAQWIVKGDSAFNENSRIITNTFGRTESQWVKVTVSEVGPYAQGEGVANAYRLQLMEFEIYDSQGANPAANIALGKAASTNNNLGGGWAVTNLTNGNYASGFSTNTLGGATPATPVEVTIDLGGVMSYDTIKLVCRTDAMSIDSNLCPNFPKTYTIASSDNNSSYGSVAAISLAPAEYPTIPGLSPTGGATKPLFASDFTIPDIDRVASARLYISGLGLFEAHINGANISPYNLEPGETDYRKTVLYCTYDVKDFLNTGENALGIMVSGGIYNVSAGNRDQKHNNNWGEEKTIAQLEITDLDGNVTTVCKTDNTWASADGPITFCSWYGGEDYDATKEIDGWDMPGTDRTGWHGVSSPKPTDGLGALEARKHPPIQVVDDPIVPKSVTRIDATTYLVDWGVNYAGYFEIILEGMAPAQAGTEIQMWPGETLSGGRVSQATSGNGRARWCAYTIKGDGRETWHPRFYYDGNRYIEVRGWTLPEPPTADNFRGYCMRTGNEKTGSIETSNEMINKINGIITRAVENNMYSSLTDCPHREKGGWLEVPHLMYYSMAYQFEIQSWMKKIVRDIMDAQYPNGHVPTVAPGFMDFGEGQQFGDDPTWGGSAVLLPWYTYQVYGDESILRLSYDTMKGYVDYLARRANNSGTPYIIDDRAYLGDWGGSGTSSHLVVTATFYELTDALAQIAALLGRDGDAAAYAALAGQIKTAFNNRFYNAATKRYDDGSQASYACALYAGLVEDDQISAVLDGFISTIVSGGYRIQTGEVALRRMLVVLGRYGRNDIVAQMILNPNTAYGYFITHTVDGVTDTTCLPEFWDFGGTQSHCMMGHGQEWFYRYMAGIDHASPGFQNIVIKPYLPDGVTWINASTNSQYGMIKSNLSLDLAEGSFSMHVEIPVGAAADIYVPNAPGYMDSDIYINGELREGEPALDGAYTRFTGLGSGVYDITREAETVSEIFAVADKNVIEIGQAAEDLGLAGPATLTVTGRDRNNNIIPLPNTSLTFTSSNPSVAAVDENGTVTGLGEGMAVITVRLNENMFTTVAITVNRLTIASIAVTSDKPGNTIEIGDVAAALGATGPAALTVVALDEFGEPVITLAPADLTFTSSHPAIATVSAAGIVTGLSAGTAAITVHYREVFETSIDISVNQTVIVGIELAPKKTNLNFVGDELRLTVNALSNSGRAFDITGNAGLAYTYVDSNPAVATLYQTGRVTRVASGQNETATFAATYSGAWGSFSGGSVTVTCKNGVNVAYAGNGGSARSSSFADHSSWGRYHPDSTIHDDGVIGTGRNSLGWTVNGGWSDSTPNVFPDWLQIDFDGKKTINEISFYNYDGANRPLNIDLVSTAYAVKDYSVEYWDGGAWAEVEGGQVVGNDKVWCQTVFDPVTTDHIRVVIFDEQQTASKQSRITWIEAYEVLDAPDNAVALLMDGAEKTGIATASLSGGQYAAALRDEKLLGAVSAGSAVELVVDQDADAAAAILELNAGLIEALQAVGGVTVTLDTPDGGMTLNVDDVDLVELRKFDNVRELINAGDLRLGTMDSAAMLAMRVEKPSAALQKSAAAFASSESLDCLGLMGFGIVSYNFGDVYSEKVKSAPCADEAVSLWLPLGDVRNNTAAYAYTGAGFAPVPSELDGNVLTTGNIAAAPIAVLKLPLDKTALKAAMDRFEATKQSDYTAASWGDVQLVYGDASEIYADDSVSQAQVDAAAQALTDAIDTVLVEAILDFGAGQPAALTLKRGQTYQLKINSNNQTEVLFFSANGNVSLSPTGLVTGVKPGVAIITVVDTWSGQFFNIVINVTN